MIKKHVNKKDLEEICIAASKFFKGRGVTIGIAKLGGTTTFRVASDFCLVRGQNIKEFNLFITRAPGNWMSSQEIYDEIIESAKRILDEGI